MVGQIYYITEELNNGKWKLGKCKGHAFENKIFEVVCLWVKKRYDFQEVKVYPTRKTNDNGKDIIITATCSLTGLFGMDFPLNASGKLKIYVECKSSDSRKIPYNDIAGNIKLSEHDGIDYYILVTNTTITPYTFFQLQDEANKKGFIFILIDQYSLYCFLKSESAMIGSFTYTSTAPTVHAEYQVFTECPEGENRFVIYLLLRNYAQHIEKIDLQLKTDHNWIMNTESLELVLSPGESVVKKFFADKLYFDGLDELCLLLQSAHFEQTITVEGINVSYDFIPPLYGEQHNYIIDSLSELAQNMHKLEVHYLFGNAGVGKTRIYNEIANRVRGEFIKCKHIICSSKNNVYKELCDFFIKEELLDRGFKHGDSLNAILTSIKPTEKEYILFLDDIHNADKTFFDEITTLINMDLQRPVLIVLSGRDDFSVGNSAYYGFINDCRKRSISIDGFDVKPLKDEESKRLIQAIIDDVPEIVLDKIYQNSNNIPLFIIQFIEYLLDMKLVKVLNRNTVGILNPETFASHTYIPEKIEEIYSCRVTYLKSVKGGPEMLEFLYLASMVGIEFPLKIFLNYFNSGEERLYEMINKYFLAYADNGNIKFAHESIYLYFAEYLKNHTTKRAVLANKLLDMKSIFFDSLGIFDIGAICCWAGETKCSEQYFHTIIEDIKKIENYSSIHINSRYREYMDEVYKVMCICGYEEEYLKNALFVKVYLALHFYTPYVAVKECDDIEETLKKNELIKDKSSFTLTLLEQKAHSYINMGQLRSAENILQSLLAKILYKPDLMDEITKFDLYDKLANINLKYNNYSIAQTYNHLARRIAEGLSDYKLLALADITFSKMNLYRDINAADRYVQQAHEHLMKDSDPRILCHNNLSKITISLRKSFDDNCFNQAGLLKDTQSLLQEAINGNYANSILRAYLLLATLAYFDDLEQSLAYANKGISESVKYGEAIYMWHFYNLKAMIATRRNESKDYINKLFTTVHHLLKTQNLLYWGNLEFSYENILAMTNVMKHSHRYEFETAFYQKLALVSYAQSSIPCDYNCEKSTCNFDCLQNTPIFKKEYERIGKNKILFVDSKFSYSAIDPHTDYYFLFA